MTICVIFRMIRTRLNNVRVNVVIDYLNIMKTVEKVTPKKNDFYLIIRFQREPQRLQ